MFVAPESVLDEGRLIEFVDAVVVDSLQEVELVQDVVDADADRRTNCKCKCEDRSYLGCK